MSARKTWSSASNVIKSSRKRMPKWMRIWQRGKEKLPNRNNGRLALAMSAKLWNLALKNNRLTGNPTRKS